MIQADVLRVQFGKAGSGFPREFHELDFKAFKLLHTVTVDVEGGERRLEDEAEDDGDGGEDRDQRGDLLDAVAELVDRAPWPGCSTRAGSASTC